ncbi:MAG: EAL domain-containing protein [Thermoleophilaceae bacterium]
MGVQTVGEGVEDESTLTALSALGVDFAQGFHIGRPQPVAAPRRRLGARGLRLVSQSRPSARG